MATTIYATFVDPAMVSRAVGAVLDHGVKAEHISLAMPESGFAQDEEAFEIEHRIKFAAESGITTTTLGDGARGVGKGAWIGFALGAVAAPLCLFVPGFGLVSTERALALAMCGGFGAAAAGAIVGALIGYLKDQGVPGEMSESEALGSGAMVAVTLFTEKVAPETIEAIFAKYEGSVPPHAGNNAYLH